MKRGLFVIIVFLIVVTIIFLIMRQSVQSTVQFVDGPTVAVEIADDASEQTQGLAGHAPLDDQQGMLFVWPNREARTFWMKGMTFAIDIIWIADGKVIGIETNVESPIDDDDILKSYFPPAPVNMVLEVAAGFSQRQNINIGDRLTVFP